MNQYALGSLVAMILLAMGIVAVIMGGYNYKVTEKNKNGVLMWNICWSVFFWNFGYAWMSLCYDSKVAYVARAVALFFIIVFMVYILRYAAAVSGYKKKSLVYFVALITVAYLLSWAQIIRPEAVTFVKTPWGYWYKSGMSWGRLVQFGSIIAAIVMYYCILFYGRNHKVLKRDKYVLSMFGWFGPILFVGYIFDTLVPILFNSAAIPGSCVSAFVSAMVLFRISTNNKIFGLTKEQVSEYVFRDVNVPVVIADYDGKIVMCNDIAPTCLGFLEENILGQELNSLFELRKDDIAKIKDKEMVCKLEQTDVHDKFGDLLYSVYFLQDITKERENLRAIQASQRMAEKANKAKSDFLANMSHEIRTPINAVLGMDEMILRESKDETILGYADNIKQSGNLLLSLINDILDFSKIENGKMEILPAEYGVASLIHDLYLMSQDRAKKKGLSLDVVMDADIPSVLYGDDVRLRQVITNLLTNAVKYTHQGRVLFSVKMLSHVGKQVKLRISVKDTGIGIREEDRERMFDAFQRVDEDINRSIEGTGLGLNITMNLLQLMGSSLQIESTYGEGSEFYFDLVQDVVDETAVGPFDEYMTKSDRRREQYQESFRAPNAKILVVDDNSMNIHIVENLLKRTEVQITSASSGYECLEYVKKQRFDVILMDHMMPGMDGIETVEEMRQLSDYPSKDAAIIALTANAVRGAREMFLEKGFDDFVSKPVKGSKLEKVLLKYIPGEAVERVEVKEEKSPLKEDSNQEKSLIGQIKKSDKVHVEEGLKYCLNDVNIYEEVVGIYVNKNELAALKELFQKKDFTNYEIKVHSVKSNSKNIGAVELSEMALQLEMAAKNRDFDYIEAHHKDFMVAYEKILDELRTYL